MRESDNLNNIESGRREAKVRFAFVEVGPTVPSQAEQRYFYKHRAWRLHSNGGHRSSWSFGFPLETASCRSMDNSQVACFDPHNAFSLLG